MPCILKFSPRYFCWQHLSLLLFISYLSVAFYFDSNLASFFLNFPFPKLEFYFKLWKNAKNYLVPFEISSIEKRYRHPFRTHFARKKVWRYINCANAESALFSKSETRNLTGGENKWDYKLSSTNIFKFNLEIHLLIRQDRKFYRIIK